MWKLNVSQLFVATKQVLIIERMGHCDNLVKPDELLPNRKVTFFFFVLLLHCCRMNRYYKDIQVWIDQLKVQQFVAPSTQTGERPYCESSQNSDVILSSSFFGNILGDAERRGRSGVIRCGYLQTQTLQLGGLGSRKRVIPESKRSSQLLQHFNIPLTGIHF